MKKSSHGIRATSRAAKLHRRDFESGLNAYTTAGQAVAAIMAAGAASVHGQTITNITSTNFGTDPHLTWQVTSIAPSAVSGSNQSNFHQSLYIGHQTYAFNPNVFQQNGSFSIIGSIAVGGLGKIARAGSRNAANLSRNAALNAADFSGNGLGTYRLFRTNNSTGPTGRLGGQGQLGNFVAAANGHATGYLGFKMGANPGAYYFGWLRVQVAADANGRPNALTLLPVNGVLGAYALSTDPSIASFKAGDMAAIPEPASVAAGLALFALGAAGVREHRKRRRAAA